MNEIRLLGKDDIEIRVAQTTKDREGVVKASLLLYKNARVDMKIMDEHYGPFGWKRSHKLLGDRLYCIVEVWDAEKKEWVAKEDVGTESNTEAEKGQASDSFKRACVNWGIGRELYTAPRISVPLEDKEYSTMQNGSTRVWATFSVKEIDYNKEERSITKLILVDKYDRVRYEYNNGKVQAQGRPAGNKAATRQTGTAAPTPAAQPSEAAKLDGEDKVHQRWVKAIATHAVNKAGVKAEDAYRDKFHPSEIEWKLLLDEVFKYQLQNGISD